MITSAVKSLLRPHRVIRIAKLREEESGLKKMVSDDLIAFTVDDPRYRHDHYTMNEFFLADCQIAIEEEIVALNAPFTFDDVVSASIYLAALSLGWALIAIIWRAVS